MTPTVILADDHASVRRALRSVLLAMDGVSVEGEATTGQEALDLIRQTQPDIAIVDIRLRGMRLPDLITCAWGVSPDTAFVMLAMHSEAPPDGELPTGIAALVSKEAAARELPEALAAVQRGGTYVSPLLSGDPQSPLVPRDGARPPWLRA